MSSMRELLIELLGDKEADREAWRLMLLIYGSLLKKAEFLLSILSGIKGITDVPFEVLSYQ